MLRTDRDRHQHRRDAANESHWPRAGGRERGASAPQRGCRVGGPAPPGAEASPVTSAFRRAPGRGCSRTGPATANVDSPTEVARPVQHRRDREQGCTPSWALSAGPTTPTWIPRCCTQRSPGIRFPGTSLQRGNAIDLFGLNPTHAAFQPRSHRVTERLVQSSRVSCSQAQGLVDQGVRLRTARRWLVRDRSSLIEIQAIITSARSDVERPRS